MPFENLVFQPQSQGGKICQAGPGILRVTFEPPRFGQTVNGILRVTFEPPRFGRAPKGNSKDDRAEGILRVTYEPPTMLHEVADSGVPRIYIYIYRYNI